MPIRNQSRHPVLQILRLSYLFPMAFLSSCSGLQLLNTLTPDSAAKILTDIAYAEGERQSLDIYLPKGDLTNAPVVVFVYGGRWSFGSKDEYRFAGEALASKGFVAVLPDYQLYPAVKFPDFIVDIAKAVAWVNNNIADYGASSKQLFLMGHSAGAHTVATLALNHRFLAAEGYDAKQLAGVIPISGPFDFLPPKEEDLQDIFGPEENYSRAEVIDQVGNSAPPMLLMHGRKDKTVWAVNSEKLANAMRKNDLTVEERYYDSLNHTLIIAALAGKLGFLAPVLDDAANFIWRESGKAP